MPKPKELLKGLGAAAAALAGVQAVRNRQFRRDLRAVELEPLKAAVREENAKDPRNVATYPKTRMVDALPKLTKEEIAENFLLDSSGQPVLSGTGEVIRRGTSKSPRTGEVGFKKGGAVKKEVWEKPRPKSLGKPKALTPKKKAAAKAAAKKAGRPYPNLVDNMRAARKK